MKIQQVKGRSYFVCAILLLLAPLRAQAQTYGPFSYQINGTEIEITGCDTNTVMAVIPSTIEGYSVVSIGANAFSSCTSLAGVSFPQTVSTIGKRAFEDCSSLTRAVYQGNVPSVSPPGAFIGVHANFVHYARAGTSPDSHPLENYDVYQDGLVIRVPEILTYVGGGTVAIPADVGVVAAHAFQGCTELAGVSFPENFGLIGFAAFDGCSSLTRAVYQGNIPAVAPDAFVGVPTNFIHYARGGSSPDTHPLQHYQTYQDGLVIGSIIPPDLINGIARQVYTYVGGGTVAIPSDVVVVGAHAFEGCTELAGVSFPENIGEIRTGAFEGCSSLTRAVYERNAPLADYGAFHGVHPDFRHYILDYILDLPVVVGSPNESYDVFHEGLVIRGPEILTFVGGGTVAVPSHVTDAAGQTYDILEVGAHAFEGCTQLAGVSFPAALSDIGLGAFEDCSSLTRAVYEGSNVINITGDAFAGVHPDFKHYTLAPAVTDYHPAVFYDVYHEGLVIQGNDVLTFVGGGTVAIPSVVIDAQGQGYNVAGIEAFAFRGCTDLAGVSFPDGFGQIGSGAFEGCSSLTRAVYEGLIPWVVPDAFFGVHSNFVHYARSGSSPDYHPIEHYDVYHEGLVIREPEILTFVGGGTIAIPAEVTDATGQDYGVFEVGAHAFENCTQLAGVSFPEVFGLIGEGAFDGCSSLTRAVYEGNVPPMYPDAFTGVHPGFEHYTRDGSSPDYHPAVFYEAYVDGLVMGNHEVLTYVGGGTVSIPAYYNPDPYNPGWQEPVDSIRWFAFENCTQLAGVSFPGTLQNINAGSFSGCTSLTRAVYEGNVPAVSPEAFFEVHPNFKHYTLGQSVPDSHPVEIYEAYVDGLVMGNNEVLTYVGGGTVAIPAYYRPENNPGLQEPVSAVDAYAFQGCSQLAGVSFPDAFGEVRSNAFHGCSSLTRAVYQGNIPSIIPYAFFGAHPDFKHYTLGQSVPDYHPVEFYDVYHEGLVIQNNEIDTFVGSGTVVIPSEVTDATGQDHDVFEVGVSAFQDCSQLAGVSFPENFGLIGSGAFEGCSSLTRAVYQGPIPAVSPDAFIGVHLNFKHYTRDGSSPDAHPAEFYEAYVDGLVLGNHEVMTYVGGGTVSIPAYYNPDPYNPGWQEPVDSIMGYAFDNCMQLAGVSIPETLQNIDAGAFNDCSSLTRAVYQGLVLPSVSPDAFIGVHPNFKHYTLGQSVPDGHPVETYDAYVDGLALGNNEVMTYVGGGTVAIPAYYRPENNPGLQEPVSAVEAYAFQGCSQLAGVSFPDVFGEIRSNAFHGCSSLTRAVYQGNIPTIIPEAFFGAHPDFKHYTLGPSVPDYHPVEFYDVYHEGLVIREPEILTYVGGGTVAIPSEVTDFTGQDYDVFEVGVSAFQGCSQLAGVSFPENFGEIKSGAFEGCSSLTRAVYEGNVPPIYPDAFAGVHPNFKHYTRDGSSPDNHPAESYEAYVDGLVLGNHEVLTYVGGGTVSIPEYYNPDPYNLNWQEPVHLIRSYAFQGCTQLENVTVPDSVIIIDNSAFADCINLTGLYFQGNEPGWDYYSALPDSDNATVYYRTGTSGWGSFPAVLWDPFILLNSETFDAIEGHFGFDISGLDDELVKVEACTNLTSNCWVTVMTENLVGGIGSFSDPGFTNHTARFYRLNMP